LDVLARETLCGGVIQAPRLELVEATDSATTANDTHGVERWRRRLAQKNRDGVSPRLHGHRELALLEANASRLQPEHPWLHVRNECTPARPRHHRSRWALWWLNLYSGIGQRRALQVEHRQLDQCLLV